MPQLRDSSREVTTLNSEGPQGSFVLRALALSSRPILVGGGPIRVDMSHQGMYQFLSELG